MSSYMDLSGPPPAMGGRLVEKANSERRPG
jgi:hypothetical protein